MNLYADSSFMVALRLPNDTFHREATDYFEEFQSATWLWSPWHRVEVFNTIRQITRHTDARRTFTAGDARALIHRLENEVRLGYFLHMEADWRDVLRQACEISAAHAFGLACPATDLLHVAYAAELASDLFVSFDDEQLDLARAAGLRGVRPE